MRKFVSGLLCGILLSTATAIYASDSVPSRIWPIQLEINDHVLEPSAEHPVLNYDGQAYVPLRLIANMLGLGIKYQDKENILSVQSEPTDLSEASRKVWQAQYRLSIGQSPTEVKQVLGDPEAILREDNQPEIWRYDIGAAPGYRTGGKEVDQAALASGALQAQLFIRWSADTAALDGLHLGYTERDAAHMREYVFILFPDGTTLHALVE
ncbi:hypothetical protein SAMN02799630_05951 [Paenibacillus sp. UNCCL117]|uniref:hypothetical protein n=1 Tax=unclassified Paenibacillus TaxID=185978 RepID=UPI00088B0122|nr:MULTISPECIES: hypothetical protein [unclassified Paenibacillus]SDE62260.1 hypothetical protein SAMN04488602_13632 [Paenibacillus sp. cl123]SFW69909.1 hypothetical protein SAMN02799630_05951 [Paenibacillus sp. UNCCL117]